jgi:Spy/CpxP family protein refolding chaperone
MLLSRASVLSVLVLSLGGAIAVANQNSLLPQLVAQNPGWSKRGSPNHLQLMQELNLTQDQQQKLKAIYSQYNNQISQRKQALRQATKEFKSLMASNASADQVRTKHREVQGLRQQLEAVSFESMLAMREVLTPAQRSQFAQRMEQRRANYRNQMRNQRGSQG